MSPEPDPGATPEARAEARSGEPAEVVPTPEPEVSGDLAAMLALLEGERARAARALEPDPRFMYGLWGLAWLVGFLALWSGRGNGPVHLPGWAGYLVFAGCIAGALAALAVHLFRRFSGLRGPVATAGAMIGWAWSLSFGSLTAIMAGLYRMGVSDDVMGMLWSVLSGLVVGILYLASGAFLRDRVQYGVGVWILVASGAGALAGFPGVLLAMGLGGGGGFLAAAAYFTVRRRVRPGGRGRA